MYLFIFYRIYEKFNKEFKEENRCLKQEIKVLVEKFIEFSLMQVSKMF